MKIAILGTGGGARSHAAKLLELGHEVFVGTRDPQATLARTEPDQMGNPPYPDWLNDHPGATLLSFGEAAAAADLVINGISGDHAYQVLSGIGEQLTGKTLIDYAVPYVYNHDTAHKWRTPWGFMPLLHPVDTDSLGEQIQRAIPGTRVVKAFVTQEQETVVDPKSIGGGDHTMFIAGDDPEAKAVAVQLLREYGWTDILDLGDLVCSRGLEMYAHFHAAVGMALGRRFGVKIV
ncbi:NAD(P)-binding domain-containing protein [Nocardia terpenica]|uniref:NADPH-dependent F420 reductase n=1 Tax=Nocardia terpenica TaxID=455432 RepID=UPI001893DF35|nr:NAD(P)-binding domain-containing protein [Nocardia terpenica]MBF6065349.1 NAD(P)-binding domain-containing protein [Nocardia terpenica]MBF6108921.1 NAD(P)-binding domain-containing protein [Nocardia terpenica]MBF6121764.1 NAD(P)-binding domain-containing protein [Nocardia terpenica]